MRATTRGNSTSAKAWPGSLIAIALGVVIFGFATARWFYPAVVAERIQFVEVPATLNDVKIQDRSSREGGRIYEVQVDYTYWYDGREFEGSRVFLAQHLATRTYRKEAEHLQAELTARSPFFAYVDADDPASSVLDDSSDGIIELGPAILISSLGATCLLLGVIGLVIAITRNRVSR